MPLPLAIPAYYLVAMTAGAVSNAVANGVNGHKQRKLQKQQMEEAREDRQQDRLDNAFRHAQNYDLSLAHFEWQKEQAETAHVRRVEERMADIANLTRRNIENRSLDSIDHVINGTFYGNFVHDPKSKNGVRSLRVLVQVTNGDQKIHAQLGHHLNAAIDEYLAGTDGNTHIQSVSGLWKPGAPTGSWFIRELHSVNQNIPTLVLRVDPSYDGEYLLFGDLCGFPMGDGDFADNIYLGKVPDNFEILKQAVALATLTTSDIYHLSSYGKMPQMPRLLAHYMQDQNAPEAHAAIARIVSGYQGTVNAHLMDNPITGVPASLDLAESLIGFEDKSFALEQVRQIQAATQSVLYAQPVLIGKLQDLYTRLDAPEDAEALNNIKRPTRPRRKTASVMGTQVSLEKHL